VHYVERQRREPRGRPRDDRDERCRPVGPHRGAGVGTCRHRPVGSDRFRRTVSGPPRRRLVGELACPPCRRLRPGSSTAGYRASASGRTPIDRTVGAAHPVCWRPVPSRPPRDLARADRRVSRRAGAVGRPASEKHGRRPAAPYGDRGRDAIRNLGPARSPIGYRPPDGSESRCRRPGRHPGTVARNALDPAPVRFHLGPAGLAHVPDAAARLATATATSTGTGKSIRAGASRRRRPVGPRTPPAGSATVGTAGQPGTADRTAAAGLRP
jgi:hypothetical protein